ncbi:hypothetical protein DFJ74DRAFT_708633 [Hyaloraphidium curvatum]|nr:hypothetical protein DFJ74DRAFT_708633 [Hyaloraphidium curvatum]
MRIRIPPLVTICAACLFLLFLFGRRRPEQRSVSSHDFVCPDDPVAGLPRQDAQSGADADIVACRPLGLALIRLFKDQDEGLVRQLQHLCGRAALANFTDDDGVDGKPGSASQRICSLPGWTCYAVVQQPLHRFLGAFYAAMAGPRDPALARAATDAGTGPNRAAATLEAVLDAAERGLVTDTRFLPQWSLLPRSAAVHLFGVHRTDLALEPFLCGAYRCRSEEDPGSCPFVDHGKLREKPHTAAPGLLVEEQEMRDTWLDRLALLYAGDHCMFRIPTHTWVLHRPDCEALGFAPRENWVVA